MTLTLTETQNRLQNTNFEALPKPRKNKGVRGQLLEIALGIPNSSKLTDLVDGCLLYTSPSPRDGTKSRMPSSA